MCPGCDRCLPPGGPCIRRMISELDGRCQECYLSPPMGLPDEGVYEHQATRRILVRKALLTNEEVLEEIKVVRREMEGKPGK